MRDLPVRLKQDEQFNRYPTKESQCRLSRSQPLSPGTTRVISASGDDERALLQVSSRVKLGPDAPEMALDGARLHRLDESQKILEERVIFFVASE